VVERSNTGGAIAALPPGSYAYDTGAAKQSSMKINAVHRSNYVTKRKLRGTSLPLLLHGYYIFIWLEDMIALDLL